MMLREGCLEDHQESNNSVAFLNRKMFKFLLKFLILDRNKCYGLFSLDHKSITCLLNLFPSNFCIVP